MREGAGKAGEVQENTRNPGRGKLQEIPGNDTQLTAPQEFPTRFQPEDGPVLRGALGVKERPASPLPPPEDPRKCLKKVHLSATKLHLSATKLHLSATEVHLSGT